MPRRKRTSEMPEGSVPPFELDATDDTTLKIGMPDETGTEKRPFKQAVPAEGPIPFDLDEQLGQIEAPGTKKAKDEPAEPAKKQTAEDKKKAADAEKKEKSRQAFLKAFTPSLVRTMITECSRIL